MCRGLAEILSPASNWPCCGFGTFSRDSLMRLTALALIVLASTGAQLRAYEYDRQHTETHWYPAA